MENKEIDWDEVDKEHQIHIKKCVELDKIIAEERKKSSGIDDLARRTEIVNNFIKENEIDSAILSLDIEKKDNKEK